MSVRDFRDLLIWQKAMALTETIYRFSQEFPARESFGLTSQIQRAAVSIASNIAEGHARESQREFARFLSIARGSLAELHTQLLLAERLGYGERKKLPGILEATEELGKTVQAHPTLMEAVSEAALDSMREAIHLPKKRR